MTDKEVITRLREECDVMRSRIEAILDFDYAIDYLQQEDVFGGNYIDLLLTDRNHLTEAIKLADQALAPEQIVTIK